MFVDVPLTSTTQSTSNRSLVAIIVIGLGLLVLGVVLFSYWKNGTRTDEHSHLLTHNSYQSSVLSPSKDEVMIGKEKTLHFQTEREDY
jgi:hypothetical protein